MHRKIVEIGFKRDFTLVRPPLCDKEEEEMMKNEG
jgi:hypothetical protein